MSKQIELESIVAFQSIEDFEDATGLQYNKLDDHDLMDVLEQWHYPGEHDTNKYDADYINTNFLGHRYLNTDYLLSRYENGLVIGLSFIVNND